MNTLTSSVLTTLPLWITAGAACLHAAPAAAPGKPNILFIVADDMGYADCGVYFISDNGGPITRNAPNASINTPLRGGKGETWEGGIRVPFILKWPGHLKSGTTFTKPVTQMDVTVTILALTGVKVNTKWPIDGVNLMPFLDAPERGDAPHRILCWEFGPQWAIREDQWKLTYARPGKGAKQPILALYNLSKDISESHDLSTEQPELVKKLQSDWNAWREDVDGGRRTPKSNTNS